MKKILISFVPLAFIAILVTFFACQKSVQNETVAKSPPVKQLTVTDGATNAFISILKRPCIKPWGLRCGFSSVSASNYIACYITVDIPSNSLVVIYHQPLPLDENGNQYTSITEPDQWVYNGTIFHSATGYTSVTVASGTVSIDRSIYPNGCVTMPIVSYVH